uniref:Uncharacterized protein n=1 Tax=Tanacetum cinerariifolium TaxID=118510 RepID=A0A6L2KQ47_TANCI|nr:hypothetical protein [Tanacetum cinerariifolium]
MNPIATQQAALDNPLVLSKKRLKICLILLNQEFVALPSEEELLSFIKELGYSGKYNMVSAIYTDQIHKPWRTFAAIINMCIYGKTTGLGRLRESLSKTKDSHKYGTLIPDGMFNQDIKDSKVYKTYYDFATRKVDPKKARKFKKIASPLRKLSPVKEAEPVKKAKRVKRPAKNSTTTPKTGVVIKDTPCVSVLKKKALAKGDRGKGIELISDAALLEAAQVKEALQKSKKDSHMLHASGSDEGTGTKPRVPDVPSYESNSDNESWGDSEDESDDINDDNDDDNANDDDSKNKDDDGNDAHDSKRNNSDDDEQPSFTLKDHDKEEHDEEYESDGDNENMFEEEDDDLYKDVDVRLLGAEHKKERKGNEEMTDNRQEESSTQAPSLFIVPEIAHSETSTAHATTIPPTISMIIPLPQLTTPSHAPIMIPTTTLILALPDFSSMFGFDQRVSTLKTELSQLKQADHSAQLLEFEFKKKAQEKSKLYRDAVEKSVKHIIKNEVKSLLPQILPKEVSDFATHVIQSTINESLENFILAKSSSQPKSTYEAAAPLTEFELKKILLDKIEKSKSYQVALEYRELYDGLVKSYNLEKDLFLSYGNVYSLKRDHQDEDKDKDPPAGSNKGLKKWKTSKDTKPPRGSKFKESKSSSSKGTQPHPKSSGSEFGHTIDRPDDEAALKSDRFKKPNKPMTPDRAWNDGKSIDSRPPQKWISNIAKARQPPRMFDEPIITHIAFSAYVMHNLKSDNLTQEILVGPAFNLLKGTCKSFVELEFLDAYFFNNDFEYLKGRSSSRKYTTFTTKTKVAKYDNVDGIKDMVLTLWSPVKELYKFYDGTFTSVRNVLNDITNNLRMEYLPKRRWSNLDRKRSPHHDQGHRSAAV